MFGSNIYFDISSLDGSNGESGDHDQTGEGHGQEEEEEVETYRSHLPKELLRWRDSVIKANSASQIMVYLLQLNDCIAWEKSIMKVVCSFWCSYPQKWP